MFNVLVEEAPTHIGVPVPQVPVRRLTNDEMDALRQRAAAEGLDVALGNDPELADQPEAGQ